MEKSKIKEFLTIMKDKGDRLWGGHLTDDDDDDDSKGYRAILT